MAFDGDVRSHGLRVACPGGFDKRSRALLARPLSFKPTAAKRRKPLFIVGFSLRREACCAELNAVILDHNRHGWAMASEYRYGVLRSLSTFLGFAGWVQVFLGALVFIVGVLSGVSSNQGVGVGILGGFVGGIAVAISGLILVAIAQALDVFIDIALNTAPIAQLVEQNAAMVAFFDNFKNGNSSLQAPAATSGIDQTPVDQGSFEGVPWRSYADGRVVAVINRQEKVFSTGAEFTAFVYSRK